VTIGHEFHQRLEHTRMTRRNGAHLAHHVIGSAAEPAP
jgi:hypothetical protein